MEAQITKKTGNDPMHCLVFPFRAAGLTKGWNKVTGMEASLIREIAMRERSGAKQELTIFADGVPGDPPEIDLPRARVRVRTAAPATASQDDRLAFWFDQMWACIHPAAFTAPCVPNDLLIAMYPHRYDSTLGSFDQMVEHYDRYGVLCRNRQPAADYVARFDALIRTIPDGSTVNWHDFFVADLIQQHGEDLRRRGAFQTFHCFLAHPNELDKSREGQRLLETMAMVDRVYFLTDRYGQIFVEQVNRLGYRMPETRRFDLGIDCTTLDKSLDISRIRAAKLMRSTDKDQRPLIADILETQFTIPHRFICLDRLDNIKGIHVVIRAVDAFLSHQSCCIEALRRLYRFYFLTDYYHRYPPVDSRNAWHRYADFVRRMLIPSLIAKYPGIVYFSDPVADRRLVGVLLRDAHAITGSVQEGLGLAAQEALYVNARLELPRSAIIGSGGGFAIQTIDRGLGHLAEFPMRGSIEEFAAAISRIVSTDAQTLRSNTQKLVAESIAPRSAGITAGREEQDSDTRVSAAIQNR